MLGLLGICFIKIKCECISGRIGLLKLIGGYSNHE